MPKSTGGGGSASKIFTTTVIGPPPGPTHLGTNDWINVASVPTGQAIWLGSLTCASPDKSTTFEVRVNVSGSGAGTDAGTMLMGSVSASPKSGTKLLDLYKNGRLHLVSPVGTGVECVWVRAKSKSNTAGSYYYTLNYTVE